MQPGESIRVKLSSEAAGAVAITEVVVRQMTFEELIAEILAVSGKDEARIRNLLLRGNLVSGATRFRWHGWEADPDLLRQCLGQFPDPDPSLAFRPEACERAILKSSHRRIEITRETGSEKPFLRRRSFWEELMRIASGSSLTYVEYSYRLRADCFEFEPGAAITESFGLLKYATLKDQLRAAPVRSVQLYTTRGVSGTHRS